MTTEAMFLANRANSEKSTGPKTEAGKERSKYNAVKHALSAKTAVLLPGEDPEAFQARIDVFKESLQPRNKLEAEFAERAALASWQLDRASRAEAARLSRSLETAPAAAAAREDDDVIALEERLFFDARGPADLYPSRDYDYQQPRTSWSGLRDDPDSPARLVNKLEGSLAGCRTLLARWGELRELLESGQGFQSTEKFKCVRLLGRQPLNAVSVPEVALVFLASHAIEPQFRYAFQELRCEIHEDRFKHYKQRLSRRKHACIEFANPEAARAALLGVIDKVTERLRQIEAKHQEAVEKVSGLQSHILAFEEGKVGESIRRHTGNCNRLMIRNVEAIQKTRREEVAEEARQRKAEAEALSYRDKAVLIMEEDGAVHYDSGRGTIEEQEGRARYLEAREKKRLLRNAESAREINENNMPRIPDYAIFMKEEKLKEEKLKAERMKAEGGRINQDIETGPDWWLNEAVGAAQNEAVEAQQNEAVDDGQNEAVEAQQNEAVDGGPDEPCGSKLKAKGGKVNLTADPVGDAIAAASVRKPPSQVGAAGARRESRRERRRRRWMSEEEKLDDLIEELADSSTQLLSGIVVLE